MIHHDKIMLKEDLIVFAEKPTIIKGSDAEAQHQTGVSMCRRLKVSWITFQNLKTCILSVIFTLKHNTLILAVFLISLQIFWCV